MWILFSLLYKRADLDLHYLKIGYKSCFKHSKGLKTHCFIHTVDPDQDFFLPEISECGLDNSEVVALGL